MSAYTVVVVGSGVAGASAAMTLRAEGFAGRVVLVGAEPELPYRRPPLSKEVLRGKQGPERIRLRPPTFYEEQAIELRPGVEAVALDPATREVALSSGETMGYDRLLLATGGRPRTLGAGPLPDGVSTLRSLADVAPLRARLVDGASLLVVGAGFVGAEVAASAVAMGCRVTMLEAAPTPLGRLLPPEVAAVYTALHRGRGVEVHTGVGVTGFARDGATGRVTATGTDGRHVTADAVVLAVGMEPACELAAGAGLAVDDGIVVDEFGETSAAGVYAAGDVANLPNLLLGGRYRGEHWQQAQNHGTVVARNLLGAARAFDEVPWCWSEQYGVNLQVAGWPRADDDIELLGDLAGLDFVAVHRRDGRLTGAVAVNRAAQLRVLRAQIAQDPWSAVAA
jgi:3-phenylpropionate/trans-cinnamate dioxygenase ferredoxin reductase component